jgi:glycosyltransferase involved in cell wall biosynthesis
MTGRTKIAIVTPYGAEPSRDHYAEFIIATGLNKLDFQVKFYTYKIKADSNYKKNVSYQNVNVARCRQMLGLSPGLFLSIIFFRPKVVLYFHPRSFLSFPAYLAARAIGAKTISEIVGILHDPYIVKDRDNPINNLKSDIKLITSWQKLFKKFFSGKTIEIWKNFIFHMPVAKADIIVAINKDEQKYIKQIYKRDSLLIYWSIPKSTNNAQKKPQGEIPKNYLFFIGQIKKRKGWDTAIDALAELKKQGVNKNLIFVAPTTDISEAKNYAQHLGVLNQVYFFTQISNEERNWFYANSEYVLAPSRYEGFGLPVFEAFNAGKPLLATDIPVYLEFLEHKKNAMISKMGDGNSLAENIKELDSKPNLASNLVLAGKKTASKYNEDVMIQKFIDLISQLTKKS